MRVPGIPYIQGHNVYSNTDGVKYGIAIHNTSNDASNSNEASYAQWRPDGISSHFYVDHDSIRQSLDTKTKAGHAGSYEGNEHAIAVEITGGNGMSPRWWRDNVAWEKLGAVLATVIRHHWPDGSFQVRRASVAEMRANPKVKAFYGHDDMRRAWGGTDHTDPGPNFPWDRLLAAVSAALGEDDMPTADEVARAVWARKNPTEGVTYSQLLRAARREAAEVRAGQAAILAAVGGADVVAAVRAELDKAAARERAERAAERAQLIAAITAELPDGPLTVDMVTAAVTRAIPEAEPGASEGSY